MFYKMINGKIVCVKETDDEIAFLPDVSHDVIEDDTIPWQETEQEIVRLPDFSFVFATDSNILENLKQEKLIELGQSFINRVSGSFKTTQNYTMQFDTSDSLKMQGAITLMEAVQAPTGYITQANDETIYNIPIETMKQVLIEMLNAYAQCHAHKQELRKIINDAQTKEELAKITISWPV